MISKIESKEDYEKALQELWDLWQQLDNSSSKNRTNLAFKFERLAKLVDLYEKNKFRI